MELPGLKVASESYGSDAAFAEKMQVPGIKSEIYQWKGLLLWQNTLSERPAN